jgi:hypothetical protein
LSGKNPYQAAQNFRQPIQDAISCIASAKVILGSNYDPSPVEHALELGAGDPRGIVFVNGALTLGLIVQITFDIVEAPGELGPWKVRTLAYNFELTQADGTQLFAFQWHPRGPNVLTPHLHLPKDSEMNRVASERLSLPKTLSKVHLPTGRVCVEEVIRFAIDDLGVEPMADRRTGWRDILREGQERHERWRQWGGSGTPPVPIPENPS